MDYISKIANSAAGPVPCRTRYFRSDGIRQSPEHSKLIADGFYDHTNVRWEPLSPVGPWAATTCIFCYGMVGSTFLNDGDEFLVDLEIGEDGEICAALHKRHVCSPILRAFAALEWHNGRHLSETEAAARRDAWVASLLPKTEGDADLTGSGE